jgi:hypothetical protein
LDPFLVVSFSIGLCNFLISKVSGSSLNCAILSRLI